MKQRCFLIAFLATVAVAQNPIVPPGVYFADPSAHVWSDGKLYVYGSLDESPTYYCSNRHHVLVTEDLLNWKIVEDVFASAGKDDQVPWTDAPLYAPDCMARNGLYFLYYCTPDVRHSEGVAVSTSPTGPFRDAKPIELYGYNQIDPSVFIDDDGQAYYLWGQFTAKMAKLKPNMTELDRSTIRDSVLTENEHHFHEGGFLTKRNGIYYFIYAHMGRSQKPTCIGYATASSPMGPYRYGGVIIDNDDCDPGNWNNHGSIVEFKGNWYVLYHRATHNSKMMRKACIEPITFNSDGSINEVEMTSQGVGGPLNAFAPIEAERACLMNGNVRIQLISENNEALAEIRNEDRAAFKYVDFGKGAKKVTVRALAAEGGIIEMCLDYPWKAVVARLEIPSGDGKTWRDYSAKVAGAAGVRALWLRFYGGEGRLFDIDRLQFESQ